MKKSMVIVLGTSLLLTLAATVAKALVPGWSPSSRQLPFVNYGQRGPVPRAQSRSLIELNLPISVVSTAGGLGIRKSERHRSGCR